MQTVEARRGRQEDRPRPAARRPCRATTPRGQVLTGSLPVAMSLFPLWLPLARGIAPRLACLQPGTKLLTPRARVKSHPRAKRLSQSRLSAADPGASPGCIPAAPFPASPRAGGGVFPPSREEMDAARQGPRPVATCRDLLVSLAQAGDLCTSSRRACNYPARSGGARCVSDTVECW